MNRSSMSILARILAEKNNMTISEAEAFIKQMFDVANGVMQADKQLKIRWLGTFKVTSVKDRESVDDSPLPAQPVAPRSAESGRPAVVDLEDADALRGEEARAGRHLRGCLPCRSAVDRDDEGWEFVVGGCEAGVVGRMDDDGHSPEFVDPRAGVIALVGVEAFAGDLGEQSGHPVDGVEDSGSPGRLRRQQQVGASEVEEFDRAERLPRCIDGLPGCGGGVGCRDGGVRCDRFGGRCGG